jgi:hypothetical protein
MIIIELYFQYYQIWKVIWAYQGIYCNRHNSMDLSLEIAKSWLHTFLNTNKYET